MWTQVLELSEKLQLKKRQLYCLSRLIHLLPNDISFLEKRYQLWMEDNQHSKVMNDLLAICKISKDVIKYIPTLYEVSMVVRRENEVLEYLEGQYSHMIARLSTFRLNLIISILFYIIITFVWQFSLPQSYR